MGYLLLAGGAEFGGPMSAVDVRAIELAGGLDAPICIIPTAAAPNNNHQRRKILILISQITDPRGIVLM